MNPKNILIVGTNNTTRSYMTEAVFRRLCEEKDLEDYATCFIIVKRMCERCFENKILKR